MLDRPYKDARGFTLVELITVMVVLTILAFIAIPQFFKYRTRAYMAGLDSNAKNIYTSSQAYLLGHDDADIIDLPALKSAGYQDSSDIVFVDSSMSLVGGNIEIYSRELNALGIDNNAVIFHNGDIETVNRQ